MKHHVSRAVMTMSPDDGVSHSAGTDQTMQRPGNVHLLGAKAVGPSSVEHSNIRLLRVWRRAQTHIGVEVLARQGRHAGVIRDISQFGAGLTGQFELARGEMVALELSDKRVVSAVVRWHRGNRGGVSFLRPLESGDPLLVDLPDLPPPISAGSIHPTRKLWATLRWPGSASRLAVWFRYQVPHAAQLVFGLMPRVGGNGNEGNAGAPSFREAQMLERACRKQGFAWLTEE